MCENAINTVIDNNGLEQKRILLAEDVKLNQYIAQRILESWGCEVTIANDGKEAVRLLQQNSFDCILMDVQMPELDGIAATELIRKLPDQKKSTIPIIALTANALAGDKEKYTIAGMNDCLAKPIDEEKLFSVISKNLSQKFYSTQEKSEDNIETQTIPQEKLYDLSMVLSVSGGNKEFIKKMIALFIETVPQNVVELKKSAESENWEQVAKIAHKLKSTIDSMGIKSLHQNIRSVESNAKQKTNLGGIHPTIQKIESVIDNCILQLQSEL
ncbi:MAG TPA: response regulator [Puia sp.]|nr:response regulator [Puia sp.]